MSIYYFTKGKNMNQLHFFFKKNMIALKQTQLGLGGTAQKAAGPSEGACMESLPSGL